MHIPTILGQRHGFGNIPAANYMPDRERVWIENIDQQYQERPIPNFYKLAGKSTEVDVTVRNGDWISLEENLNIQVISTAGHSGDGVSYRLSKSLFLGDAIPVKGDIPIYINVRDTFKTLQTIRDLDGIEHILQTLRQSHYDW